MRPFSTRWSGSSSRRGTRPHGRRRFRGDLCRERARGLDHYSTNFSDMCVLCARGRTVCWTTAISGALITPVAANSRTMSTTSSPWLPGVSLQPHWQPRAGLDDGAHAPQAHLPARRGLPRALRPRVPRRARGQSRDDQARRVQDAGSRILYTRRHVPASPSQKGTRRLCLAVCD